MTAWEEISILARLALLVGIALGIIRAFIKSAVLAALREHDAEKKKEP